MTPLAPLPRTRVAVPYPQPPRLAALSRCAHPRCGRPPQHGHHIFARSYFGIKGGVDWVLIDDELVSNIADLCWEHHDQLESGVNGCCARLRWAAGWVWYRRQKPSDRQLSLIRWTDEIDTWIMVGFLKGAYVTAS